LNTFLIFWFFDILKTFLIVSKNFQNFQTFSSPLLLLSSLPLADFREQTRRWTFNRLQPRHDQKRQERRKTQNPRGKSRRIFFISHKLRDKIFLLRVFGAFECDFSDDFDRLLFGLGIFELWERCFEIFE
jgi:hypothetical protein